MKANAQSNAASSAQPVAQPGDPLIVIGALAPDNTLPLSVLHDGLAVRVPRWIRVDQGDQLEIRLDGYTLYTLVVDAPAAIGDFVDWTVPAQSLPQEGRHEMDYLITASSGFQFGTEPTPILINRTPPIYDNIPVPPRFPEEVIANGITAQYLALHDDQVLVEVPAYLGMQAGDRLHGFWAASQALLPVPVSASDIARGWIALVIPGDLIRATGDGRHTLHYHLTSRAGFDGKHSQIATVQVSLAS
ncbi:hypothetical protein [Pseudomonas knackmussii]|uniref:hypothetical protein n=1 Tax=Pseudomonas knackmussii TaxID=65741 RepID=UPI001362EE55|nr:hypothetical protein [Pseudomonas knackmussii]